MNTSLLYPARLLLFLAAFGWYVPVHAQKIYHDGQFTFQWTTQKEGKITEVARSVILARGKQQRFETQTNGRFLGLAGLSQFVTYPEQNKAFYGVWGENKLLVDSATINLKEILQKLQDLARPMWKIDTFREDRKNILGYECHKTTATTIVEDEKIHISLYITPDIKLPFNGFFCVHYPGVVVNGFPLEIVIEDSIKQQSITIQTTSLLLEKPDNIWFDLTKTRYYPLFDSGTMSAETAADNRFLVHWYQHQQQQQTTFWNSYLPELQERVETTCIEKGTKTHEQFTTSQEKIARAADNLYIQIGTTIATLDAYTENLSKPLLNYFFADDGKLESIQRLFNSYTDMLLQETEALGKAIPLSPSQITSIQTATRQALPDTLFSSEKHLKNLSAREVFLLLCTLQNAAYQLSATFWGSLTQQIDAPPIFSRGLLEPILVTPKSAVLKGESFKGEVFLGTYVDLQPKHTIVSVNGKTAPIQNGKAIFEILPDGSSGSHQAQVAISIRNPFNGKVEKWERTYEYETLTPAISISPDKMAVLYAGVPNPVTIAAAGISAGDLIISAKGAEIRKESGNRYIVTANQIGTCEITVFDRSRQQSIPFSFRVKRIPKPEIALPAGNTNISAAIMKEQKGLLAILTDFDFDARCVVSEYTLVHIPQKGDTRLELAEKEPAFSPNALAAVQAAQKGDLYLFKDVKGHCPGDKVAQAWESLIVEIK